MLSNKFEISKIFYYPLNVPEFSKIGQFVLSLLTFYDNVEWKWKQLVSEPYPYFCPKFLSFLKISS